MSLLSSLLPAGHHDVAATKALYRQANKQLIKCSFAHPKVFAEMLRLAVLRTLATDDGLLPRSDLLNAFLDCTEQVYETGGLHKLPPLPPDQLLRGIEGARFRDLLHASIKKSFDHAATFDAVSHAFIESLLRFHNALPPFLKCDPAEYDKPAPSAFTSTLIDVLPNASEAIHNTSAPFFSDEIDRLDLFAPFTRQLMKNLYNASGHPYPCDKVRASDLTYPADSELPPRELAAAYFKGTPFHQLFHTPVPFAIPEQSRFEHTHIVAGSGHGKTQTLQHLIASDLTREDHPALVVIDSQGDLIRKISRLCLFEPGRGNLASNLVIIDPTDVLHPPALNMFDVKQERLGRYNEAAREQILNGVVELYDYMFGSLLGAELTQKQSVIFRYLARLMLIIPGATIHDLLNLMTDATPYLPHIEALPPGARSFFDMEFSDRSFTQTKKQIQRRLWGVLENPTFERMFTAPVNRVDMFDALNSGKIVLVNTAKDFLKAERSSLLGRFFIALTLQATLERAALAEGQRRPAFLYIDEAADYFDSNIDDLLTQARKYKLGVVFSHQYLDQLAPGLRASIAANTSIKLAGGVSTADARSLAPDMRTKPDFILDRHKGARATSFACYVRNFTTEAISLAIPFGVLEQQPTMDEIAFDSLIAENRARISVLASAEPRPRAPARPPPPTAPQRHERAPEAPPQEEAPAIVPKPVEVAPAAPIIARESEEPKLAAPVPPAKPKQPRPEPAALGLGGRQHKYLQHLLKGAAQERGYHTVIEEPVLGGAGKVDLSLTKGGRKIACEISVTTSKNWELGNIEKCLAAGYDQVILVAADERQLKALSRFVSGQLDEKQVDRVLYLTPDGVIAYLDELDVGAPPVEETIRGYRVKVRHGKIDAGEAMARRDAIAAVLARSLKG